MKNIKYKIWNETYGKFVDDCQGFASFNIDGSISHEYKSEMFFVLPIKDSKGKNIVEGDIYFKEDEYDYGDERSYSVCTWIEEWSTFAFLSTNERYDYDREGIKGIDGDPTMRNTFFLENNEIEGFHYKGHIKEIPKYYAL